MRKMIEKSHGRLEVFVPAALTVEMGGADLPAVFAKRSQVLQVLGTLSNKVGPGLKNT